MTRFLAAGFVTVIPTFHSAVVPQGVWDMLAIVDHVKQMREVDPTSVVLYGCSAGGDLVLKLAGETEVAATTAEEPVTLGFTGMFTEDTPKAGASFTLADLSPMWADPPQVLHARDSKNHAREDPQDHRFHLHRAR